MQLSAVDYAEAIASLDEEDVASRRNRSSQLQVITCSNMDKHYVLIIAYLLLLYCLLVVAKCLDYNQPYGL